MRGIAGRIAFAALLVALTVATLLAIGVLVFSKRAFDELMVSHGETVEAAEAMFTSSVTQFFVAALVVAAGASVVLAVILARRLAMPLREMSHAARRIADGDYTVRVSRAGPEEVASLADSFNQMAGQIAEQERLRREFVSNAAHELRTPLTNLQGYLEALRDGVVAADRDTFVSLHEEVERLMRLSRSLDLLAEGDLAERAGTALRDLDLRTAIEAAVYLAEASFERRRIALELEVPVGLRALANADHVAQVLANLLQNAVRYTPEGGLVVVSARRSRSDVLVSVANTGAGIPAEDLPHVFERFYRVDKSRERSSGGAGIGLAIVKALVELGGGRVGAESSPERTRFWFSLPAAGSAHPAA
jgi:two-component system, OmpR family, sensor histidine kinase BaeS